MSIAIVAEFKVKSGRGDDFAKYIAWHQTQSRQEPGCQFFNANRDIDDSETFVMYEIYDDEAAIEAHRETAHYQKFLSQIIPDMLTMHNELPFVSRRLLTIVD